jgi:hypothetical protein
MHGTSREDLPQAPQILSAALIRVLPDGFLLKAIVFTVCEHEYTPPIIASSYDPDLRPVYTTSVLGMAPLKMGTVPKLPLHYLLVYTTTFCRHTFMISTVPIGKRHLYFPFTTVYFKE